MRLIRTWFLTQVLALGACGESADPAVHTKAENAAASFRASPSARTGKSVPVRASTATAITTAQRSCATDTGTAAAARRVAVCLNVSPATHPPCNAANSCAMIEDEISRSCALFDDNRPPMKGCGPDPKGMEAAADVVRRYYSAIDAHDYATSWTQWGDDGRPGQTFKAFEAFEAGFAHTRSTQVTIGPLEHGGGGAGSIYQPVPVTVEATLDDGTRQHFTGTYVVRRVNDVDGASASQLRWHLGSAELRRAPTNLHRLIKQQCCLGAPHDGAIDLGRVQ